MATVKSVCNCGHRKDEKSGYHLNCFYADDVEAFLASEKKGA